MEDRDRDVLKVNRMYLSRNIRKTQIVDVVNALYSRDVFTYDDMESILNEPRTSSKVFELLDRLVCCGPKAFDAFLQVLQCCGCQSVAATIQQQLTGTTIQEQLTGRQHSRWLDLFALSMCWSRMRYSVSCRPLFSLSSGQSLCCTILFIASTRLFNYPSAGAVSVLFKGIIFEGSRVRFSNAATWLTGAPSSQRDLYII